MGRNEASGLWERRKTKEKQKERHCLSKAPRFLKQHWLLEGSQASPVCLLVTANYEASVEIKKKLSVSLSLSLSLYIYIYIYILYMHESVPHSKHSISVIQTSQLMVYREIIAVCSQIHTKHINTLCGQKAELPNVKLAVHIVTTGL